MCVWTCSLLKIYGILLLTTERFAPLSAADSKCHLIFLNFWKMIQEHLIPILASPYPVMCFITWGFSMNILSCSAQLRCIWRFRCILPGCHTPPFSFRIQWSLQTIKNTETEAVKMGRQNIKAFRMLEVLLFQGEKITESNYCLNLGSICGFPLA